MDPAVLPSPLACVRHLFVMVYLLECTRRCQTECGCGKVPDVPLTVNNETDCFPIGGRFRYTCRAGYVRKAGTSNLIKCMETQQWSAPTLQCIVNPLNPPQSSTVPPVSPVNFTPEKTETPPSELTSTVLPLLHTTPAETPLETTPPQTKTPLETTLGTSQMSNSPGFSTVSSSTTSAPVSPLLSTSTASSTSTTRRSRILDRTTSPSDSSNSTSSLQHGSPTDATKVIAPVAVGIILVAVAVAGGIWFLYRRKSRNSLQLNGVERATAEERILMQQTDGNT